MGRSPTYRRAIEIQPHDAPAHNNLGPALAEKNKTEEAIAEVRRALNLDPNNAYAHDSLGFVLRTQDELDKVNRRIPPRYRARSRTSPMLCHSPWCFALAPRAGPGRQDLALLQSCALLETGHKLALRMAITPRSCVRMELPGNFAGGAGVA